MYATIKGRYEKGKLILEETPPVEVAEVFVIFLQAPADFKTPHPVTDIAEPSPVSTVDQKSGSYKNAIKLEW